jgi:hypothetical protein
VQISAIVEALAGDLAALGALADDATADTARRLAAAMEGPLTVRLLQTMSQIAAEVDVTLPHQRVEVRLVGGDVEMVVVDEAPPVTPDQPPAPPDGDADARITLRLSSPLKSRIEEASASEGISVNTYIVRALARHARADRGAGHVGRRLTGYGKS